VLAVIDALQFDWDSIQVEFRWDEKGTQEVLSKSGLSVKLGLQNEDERGKSKERIVLDVEVEPIMAMILVMTVLPYLTESLYHKMLQSCLTREI
jgi:hypothetical protein